MNVGNDLSSRACQSSSFVRLLLFPRQASERRQLPSCPDWTTCVLVNLIRLQRIAVCHLCWPFPLFLPSSLILRLNLLHLFSRSSSGFSVTFFNALFLNEMCGTNMSWVCCDANKNDTMETSSEGINTHTPHHCMPMAAVRGISCKRLCSFHSLCLWAAGLFSGLLHRGAHAPSQLVRYQKIRSHSRLQPPHRSRKI